MSHNKAADLILGIDTSNYTTSIALTSVAREILWESRKPLRVKDGERGLRQSEALFQHMDQLPVLIQEAMQQGGRERIKAIAVSSRPRSIDGSYMPVFLAGVKFGTVLASALDVPIFHFSHQQGHLEAVTHGSTVDQENEYLAFHLSGGTCELLRIRDQRIEIIGGSKDISYGQLIDRIGVSLKFPFPCGQALDEIARIESEKIGRQTQHTIEVKPIPLKGFWINLSGIESQLQRSIQNQGPINFLVSTLFEQIADSIIKLTEAAIKQMEIRTIVFAGGVAGSTYLRNRLMLHFGHSNAKLVFADPQLSSDNAVGISLLGGKAWQRFREKKG